MIKKLPIDGPVVCRFEANQLPPPYLRLKCKNVDEVKQVNRSFQSSIIAGVNFPLDEIFALNIPM